MYVHIMVEKYFHGIYYVNKEGFIPVQIIVSKELDEENYVWINTLTNKMNQKKH